MSILNYETQAEFMPEIKQAIQFDIRDNPGVRDILTHLTLTKGKAGEKDFLKLIEQDVRRQFSKEPGPVMFPWTRAAFKTYVVGGELHSQFGMGQIASLISAAVGALAQAGSSIYGAKLQADTQLKLTKLTLAADQQKAAEERAVIERQIAAQQAATAALQQAGAAAGISIPGMPTSSGMPQVAGASMFGGMFSGTTGLLTMAGLLAGIGYIVYKKTRG